MKRLASAKTRTIFETAGSVRVWGSYKTKEMPRAARVKIDRQIVVEAQPHIGIVRLKGERTAYTFTWEQVYQFAVKNYTDYLRALKKADRKAAKKARRK